MKMYLEGYQEAVEELEKAGQAAGSALARLEDMGEGGDKVIIRGNLKA